ncbi:CDP-glycerol glycerophosphotransferase family protein [Bacillus sp. SL00103]
MIVSDVLITDYSSVIFEYSLLNKPMFFYCPDLEAYVQERDFYFPFFRVCARTYKNENRAPNRGFEEYKVT